MTAERELMLLKSALRLWANSKTYPEACRRWTEVARLMGENVAADELTPPKQSESRGS